MHFVSSQNKRDVNGAGIIAVACCGVFERIWLLNFVSQNWQNPFAKLLNLSPLVKRISRYSTFIFPYPCLMKKTSGSSCDLECLCVLSVAQPIRKKSFYALSLCDQAFSFKHLGDYDESCVMIFFHPSTIVSPAARSSLVVNTDICVIV